MIVAPNSPRPGVIGGFAITPQAKFLSAGFGANSTYVGIGGAPVGWSPTIGDEIEFVPGDIHSGMAFVVGSVFNWRGPLTANTAYAVNDCFVWYDSTYRLQTWVVLMAWTSPPDLFSWNPVSVDYRAFTFKGQWTAGTNFTIGDVAIAPDGSGHVQTWVAGSSFTSSGSFATDTQWVGALAAQQIFYIVGISAGTIQISNTPTGAPITFMTGGFYNAPNTVPNLNIYIGVGVFGSGAGLVPALSLGALFAQGALYQPISAPVVPAAPTNQFSYLAYNSISHWYWTANPNGTTAGDAVVGWVETNATDIVAASNQNIPVAAVSGGSFAPNGSGVGLVPLINLLAPTPTSGIAAAGGGTVTWDPITFLAGADPSQITAATIVLLYQDGSAAATAHVATALTNSALPGAVATLVTDTDLTGIVYSGDWLLIGGEMLFVTADAASASVAVDRALGLTTAEAHAIGDPIYLLKFAAFSYAFPPLFFLNPTQAAGWGPTETLPNALIALFNVVVYASDVESLQSPINYSQAVGGLIATGAPAGALTRNVVGAPVDGVSTLGLLSIASVQELTLSANVTVHAPTSTGAPYLWVLLIDQDGTGAWTVALPSNIRSNFVLTPPNMAANTRTLVLVYAHGDGTHSVLFANPGLPIT